MESCVIEVVFISPEKRIVRDAVVRAEGIIPAPEVNHAVAGTICKALRSKEERERPTILFNLCGHAHFDMQSYIDYPAEKLPELRLSG